MTKKARNKQNNYVFIDSQNLNLSIKDCGWELDFARFRQYSSLLRKFRKYIVYLNGLKIKLGKTKNRQEF